MSIPLKSNRLIVAESLIDRHSCALPESADEVMAYAGLHGIPITAEEALDVLECFRQVSALAGKGVIVDEGRWCGLLCDRLTPTRGQRIVERLEALLGQGATHVMHVDSGMSMTIVRAIDGYRVLDDNAIGLQAPVPGRSGLLECDRAGRKILRDATVADLLAGALSGVVIRDDGRHWHGFCGNIDDLPGRVGIGGDEPVVATALPVDSLDRAVVERAMALARNAGEAGELRQAFRVNGEAYLITFRSGS